ncbi:MalM family protein [Agarivorans sp. MS3-6]|uniref:MalM family protein n=1 Tax=Agarivorans sp. TSD2052 TaxID=2937286 RepID=UPI00200F8B2F|nr:MalM family protein [Agarivorans sp. TSD2052]UPW19550.1 MalM family protein [Agarivorans sp. TSD2052]
MKLILATSVMLALVGCSNNASMVVDYGTDEAPAIQQVSAEEGYQALARAPICCASLAELSYLPVLEPGKFDFTITADDPVFDFTTGRSFVKAIALPKAEAAIKIAVSAPILNSVFAPSILVLDQDYKPLKVFGDDAIAYDNSSIITVDRLFGDIELPASYAGGQKASYLVVFTTAAAMDEQTTLTPPSSRAAESGRVDANVKIHMNKPIPHTAIGAVRLAFDYTPTSQSLTEAVAAAAIVDASAATVINESVATEPLTQNTPQAGIQPEVDEMFSGLIEKAVASGDYNKAIKIVEDAEKAGSSTARDVLVDAMKKHAQ